MALDLRGLFGSSARQAMQPGGSFTAYADPKLDDPISRQTGIVQMDRAPRLAPPQQRPSGADRLSTLGAALSDAGMALRGGQGNSLARVQEGFRARSEKAKADTEMERLQTLASSLYGDDEEAQLLFLADPSKFVSQRLEERRPKQPILVNTRLGPRLYNPESGEYRSLEDIPERLPPGYRYDEEGNPVVDPNYVAGQGALAEARAAAQAKYRAPPRGRTGGGGGGRPMAPRRAPWED